MRYYINISRFMNTLIHPIYLIVKRFLITALLPSSCSSDADFESADQEHEEEKESHADGTDQRD